MDLKNPMQFVQRVLKGMSALGSQDHRDFGRSMAQWMAHEKKDYAQFAANLTHIVHRALDNTTMDTAVVVSVVRDIVPFTVGSAWWSDLGFPCFNLTGDFFRAVSVTDFGDVGSEPMHMPFPAYVVHLPESLRGRPNSIPLFLYPVPVQDKDGLLSFAITQMSIGTEPEDARHSYTRWGNGIRFNEFLGDNNVRLTDDLDPLEAYTTKLMGSEMDPEVTKRARRVLGNTLLYINANGGLPPEKRIGADVPVEREHQLPRFRVGRPIKLGLSLRHAIREAASGGAAWKLESRFVVRGHWRNQAYGPEHSLRRKQWIQPYYKGPEGLSEALERTFEVT